MASLNSFMWLFKFDFHTFQSEYLEADAGLLLCDRLCLVWFVCVRITLVLWINERSFNERFLHRSQSKCVINLTFQLSTFRVQSTANFASKSIKYIPRDNQDLASPGCVWTQMLMARYARLILLWSVARCSRSGPLKIHFYLLM